MTDRRPHWDDYLLASVMIHCNDIYQCYAVIAAVEDWHRDRWTGVCESPEEVVRELKQAQAAIKRVRELHRPSQSTIWSHDLQQAITVTTCQHCGSDPYPCPTIKALDGDSDD